MMMFGIPYNSIEWKFGNPAPSPANRTHDHEYGCRQSSPDGQIYRKGNSLYPIHTNRVKRLQHVGVIHTLPWDFAIGIEEVSYGIAWTDIPECSRGIKQGIL